MTDDPKTTDDEDDDDDDAPAVVDDDDDEDDDDEDDDEEEDDEMTTTRTRGGRTGSGGSGGRSAAQDLASDPRFYIRLFSNLVQVIAGGLGGRVANQPWMARGITAIEGLLGGVGLGISTAGAAALIQNPKLIRSGLRTLGVPEEYVNLLDEAIDSFIHGLGHSVRTKGKITEGDLGKATSEAKEKARTLLLESATFTAALLSLEPARQRAFQASHAALDEEGKKAFEAYRSKIVGNRWELFNLMLTLLEIPETSWIDHLKLAYGEVKPASTGASDVVSGIIKTVVGVVKDLDATVVKAIAPPATGPDPVRQELKRVNKWLKKRR